MLDKPLRIIGAPLAGTGCEAFQRLKVCSMRPNPYRVHGVTQSYFTRKMTGYLDYKGIPWVLRRFPGASPESVAAGFPGGIPVVQTPEGELMWDSTSMIHHLELRFPEPAILPPDPVPRFLCYVIEDASDEWFYRPAVGAILDRACVLPFFADYVALAGSIPDCREPPRPTLNRPFPPDGA